MDHLNTKLVWYSSPHCIQDDFMITTVLALHTYKYSLYSFYFFCTYTIFWLRHFFSRPGVHFIKVGSKAQIIEITIHLCPYAYAQVFQKLFTGAKVGCYALRSAPNFMKSTPATLGRVASRQCYSKLLIKHNTAISIIFFCSRTKSRISSTGSSISEDVKGLNPSVTGGRTFSESDPNRVGGGGPETEESRGTVTIYDVLPLWPFSTELAQK